MGRVPYHMRGSVSEQIPCRSGMPYRPETGDYLDFKGPFFLLLMGAAEKDSQSCHFAIVSCYKNNKIVLFVALAAAGLSFGNSGAARPVKDGPAE